MIRIQTLLKKCLLLVFVTLYFEHSNAMESAEKISLSHCESKSTCDQCMQTNNCAWCMQPDFSNTSRCFQSDRTTYCREGFTWNPQSWKGFVTNLKLTAENFTRYKKQKGDDIVQISPQRVSLKLRLNEAYSLKIRYSQAQDYPVDLYYLMDLSRSMEDDKKKLSALADLLSETMRNITSNFRVGFGSFVDKTLEPFVSTMPHNLKEPCPGCDSPYGFKNAMSLSTDTTEFAKKVKNINISANIDGPEGGLDAIMQVTACRKIIGWREQARRLVIFSTDNRFHYAGDGKLGGVVLPNDGECHLNSDGFYTHSELQDYPSIAQINRKVKENSINIIFAVTASHFSIYKKLSQHIEGSSTGTLTEDSSNVVNLIKEEYDKISSSIEMKDNATNHIKITYHSNCLNGGPEVPTSKCDDLKVGDIVNFTAEILATYCPSDSDKWNEVIQIYPVGINESLILDLEVMCSCPCKSLGSIGYQKNSLFCDKHGTQICGVCECDDLYFGRNCECSAVDSHSKKDKELGCRPDNVTTIDCNGRGYCFCGVCQCDARSNKEEIISGRYCECDNFSCHRQGGELCSGSEHGICECGICICKPGWTGPSCDCRSYNETCISPESGEICSRHGYCECGACNCKSTKDRRYSGEFCEKCSTCSSRCHELKNCVQCQMYKTGPLRNYLDCTANCTTFVANSVQKVEIDEESEENICIFYDENDCKFTFKYSEKEEIIQVYAEMALQCPSKLFIFGLMLVIISTIVFVGLGTLLLWKLLTIIHDRREFAKFEKERLKAQWHVGGNPIFTPATSTFENPTYCAD